MCVCFFVIIYLDLGLATLKLWNIKQQERNQIGDYNNKNVNIEKGYNLLAGNDYEKSFIYIQLKQ